MRTARTEMPARASLLILHTQPAPRPECLAEGGDILDHGDGVSKISEPLRSYHAPEAVDEIRQQVMRFMRFRRADQSIRENIAEFDLLRGKAEPQMEMGAGFPDQFASKLRMADAAQCRQEKSLIAASCRESLRFAAASANIRRFFGSRGSGGQQDAVLTEDAVGHHKSAAYKTAKKNGQGRGRKRVCPKNMGTR